MASLLTVLYTVITLAFARETSSQSSEEDVQEYEDKQNMATCCSESNCCVSLVWLEMQSGDEDVPEEFGGHYYCDTFEVELSAGCDESALEYVLLPVSSSCDLTRVLWDLQCDDDTCPGFQQGQVLDDGGVSLNSADELLISPENTENPTGYHALKVPFGGSSVSRLSVCSQLQWGDTIDQIDGKPIQIGYNVDDTSFSCPNTTVRDLCSIDTAQSAQTVPVHLWNLNAMGHSHDPTWDWPTFFMLFETYWNQWAGLGISLFAASCFFNVVMCIYRSERRKMTNEFQHRAKASLDDDDFTDTESLTDDPEREDY